jgi:hypothetical protein
MRLSRGIASLWLAAWFGLALSACAGRQPIPNTDVEDNDFNRAVVEFCEEYRHAVERRNTALLLRMAHPSYYEDGGNVDPTDDLDFAGLRESLRAFRQAKAIRYEIRYRRVTKTKEGMVHVDYTYSASYKIPSPRGDIWQREVADNRLELLPEGETFRIVAGM